MAIPTQNLVLTGNSNVPVGPGTIMAIGGTDHQELAYKGIVTFTLDGAATTATLNFIDGTNGLFFSSGAVGPGQPVTFVAPSAVVATVVGGSQPAAAYITAVADLPTTTGCTIRFSIAGTNANTVKLLIQVYR